MSNNFSYTVYLNLDEIEIVETALGPAVQFALDSVVVGLGPPTVNEINSIVNGMGPAYSDAVRFFGSNSVVNLGGEIMNNLIQASDSSAIQVTTLLIANKAGTGPASLVAPTGTSYILKGVRFGRYNLVDENPVQMGQEQSGFVWSNTGSVGGTVLLPSGALEGTSALFIRTGGPISVVPDATSRIFAPASGYFRPFGQSIILSGSGTRVGLQYDGSGNWITTMENGTIT